LEQRNDIPPPDVSGNLLLENRSVDVDGRGERSLIVAPEYNPVRVEEVLNGTPFA
jgi:hypothetical protein